MTNTHSRSMNEIYLEEIFKLELFVIFSTNWKSWCFWL